MIDNKVNTAILDLLIEQQCEYTNICNAYDNLDKESWTNQVVENVVYSREYENFDPTEASLHLAMTFNVATLIKERLERRFSLIICASSPIFPYTDSKHELNSIMCRAHTISTNSESFQEIADTLVTFIRLTAKDEDDTLFIYRLIIPTQKQTQYITNFATVKRNIV
jgi:hypothetical protein